MSATPSDPPPPALTRADAIARLQTVLANVLGLETADSLTPDARLREELGLDSLAMVDLIIELEDAFGLTLQSSESVELFESVNTVGDAADLMVQLAAKSVGDG